MSDITHEAPERIWAVTEPNDISADILGDVYAQQVPDGMVGTPVEYVRCDMLQEIFARYSRVEADYIKELEAKLEKAVEALDTALSEMVDYADTHPAWSEIWEAREAARTTLAELKGENDE